MSLFLPAISAAINAEDRVNANHRLTVTAAALAVHRARHEAYPVSLEELVPDVLETVPIDLYSGKPLLYERRGEGYLLYSVFEDGDPNGGNSQDGEVVDGEWLKTPAEDAWNSDRGVDLVIRVPRPPFELPPLPDPNATEFGYGGYGGEF
ncbi:MAG: hypothetical protein AAFX76_14700, partial [Planctomycetota bacterium]